MTWIWASLIEGIGKLYGAKVQATVKIVNKVEDAEVAAMRQDSTFKQRARCELWYALDSALLEIIDLGHKSASVAVAEKLALMWLCRESQQKYHGNPARNPKKSHKNTMEMP